MKRIISNQLKSAQGFLHQDPNYPAGSGSHNISPKEEPWMEDYQGKAIEIWENAGEEDAEKLVQAVAEVVSSCRIMHKIN